MEQQKVRLSVVVNITTALTEALTASAPSDYTLSELASAVFTLTRRFIRVALDNPQIDPESLRTLIVDLYALVPPPNGQIH